jgi:hypothetical protein
MELADPLSGTFRCIGLRLLRCTRRRQTMQRTARGPNGCNRRIEHAIADLRQLVESVPGEQHPFEVSSM